MRFQQREEFEEQQQIMYDKFAEYDLLIEQSAEEHERDDAEIEKLKQEVAARRAKDEADEAGRAKVRERYAKKDEEKDEPNN